MNGFGRVVRLAVVLLAFLVLWSCNSDDDGKVVITQDESGDADYTGTVTVSWNPPSQRENGDGLALADISGYKVYYGRDQGGILEGEVIPVIGANTQTQLIDGLEVGANYYFAVSTVDQGDQESRLSTVVSRVIQ